MHIRKIEIIADLDGTIYPIHNLLTSQIDEGVERFLQTHSSIGKEGLEKLEKSHPNVLDALRILNISREEFYNNVYSQLKYEECIKKDPQLINILKHSDFNLTIVSLSPRKHITKILELMQLLPFVTDIYSLENEENTDKANVYSKIINKTGLSAKEFWVVGDNYEIDIAPAAKLGCKTAFITEDKAATPQTFTSIIDFLDHQKGKLL